MKDHVRSNWRRTVLVCAKCERRSNLPLAKRLRKLVGKGRKAPVGIVEVKCLGICPKQGVVLVDSAAPGMWKIVRADADASDVATDLGLSI